MIKREKIGMAFMASAFYLFMGFLSYYGFSNGNAFAGIFTIIMSLVITGLAFSAEIR